MGKYSHIWSDEQLLRTTAASCCSIVEVMRSLGVTANNGNTGTLKAKCRQYGIDLPTTGASLAGSRTGKMRRRTVEGTFIHGSKIVNGVVLKRMMIEHFNIKDQCVIEECGQLPWRLGKPLTLQVDHVDGDRFNNSIENLRILCPDCHSQTDTYAGRKRMQS